MYKNDFFSGSTICSNKYKIITEQLSARIILFLLFSFILYNKYIEYRLANFRKLILLLLKDLGPI